MLYNGTSPEGHYGATGYATSPDGWTWTRAGQASDDEYRLQGGVPTTPLDLEASRRNYAAIGTGVLDYTQLNSVRLDNFSQLDIRIDKKWNFRRLTLDVFIDIQNLLNTVNPAPPNYTFERTPDGKAFVTSDGKPLQTDGSNAIPILLENTEGSLLPTVGIVVEF
jgi:hypothetical protein